MVIIHKHIVQFLEWSG